MNEIIVAMRKEAVRRLAASMVEGANAILKDLLEAKSSPQAFEDDQLGHLAGLTVVGSVGSALKFLVEAGVDKKTAFAQMMATVRRELQLTMDAIDKKKPPE